jgi:hypothetical protein
MQGFLTISGVSVDGKVISTQAALDRGLIKLKNYGRKPAGWDIAKHEIPLGYNTMVDNGRQFLAYLFGGRTPMQSFSCSGFGIGTGTLAPNVANTDLQAPIAFYDDGVHDTLQFVKPITGVDFPAPMIARVEFQLAQTEANGLLITELGLYASDLSGSGSTLLCRKTLQGLEKQSTTSPCISWRIRT